MADGDDTAMLATVTSANIACGFHAGDPSNSDGAQETASAAWPRRRPYRLPRSRRLRQLATWTHQAPNSSAHDLPDRRAAGPREGGGTRVRYVKPHGALYNTIAHDARQAAV